MESKPPLRAIVTITPHGVQDVDVKFPPGHRADGFKFLQCILPALRELSMRINPPRAGCGLAVEKDGACPREHFLLRHAAQSEAEIEPVVPRINKETR
jgi:hypothetical protein